MYQPTYTPLDPLSLSKRNFKRHLNIVGIILILAISRLLLSFIIRVYQIASTKSFFQPDASEFIVLNNFYFFVFYARYFINGALFILFYVLASDFNKLEEALPEFDLKSNRITISLIFGATIEIITMIFNLLRIQLVQDILICFTPVPFIIAFWFMKDLFSEMEKKKIIKKRADRFLLYSQIYVLFINIIQISLQNTVFSNWDFNISHFTFIIITYITSFIYYGLFLLGVYRTSTDFKQIIVETPESVPPQQPIEQEIPTIDSNYKYCIRCGSRNRKTSKFCSKCGEKIE